jgi:hypothetical protein
MERVRGCFYRSKVTLAFTPHSPDMIVLKAGWDGRTNKDFLTLKFITGDSFLFLKLGV